MARRVGSAGQHGSGGRDVERVLDDREHQLVEWTAP